MTSHLIEKLSLHDERRAAKAKKTASAAAENCVFCAIVAGKADCYEVYADDHVKAFLDVLPIREGHTLVIPKEHYARLDHLPDETASRVGAALPKIARGVGRAVDQPDFNLMNNNGYAQVVHHVHFHVVPAPKLGAKRTERTDLPDGRDELDPEAGAELAKRIAKCIAEDAGPTRRAAL